MSNVENETIIWSQLRKADPEAFQILYDKYWTPLFLYAYRILNNKQEAQDILQLFFSDLWEKSATLPFVTDIRPYLFRGLKNRILNSIRDKQIEEKQIAAFYEVLDETDTIPDDLMHDITFKDKIIPLLEILPPRMQEVLQMHYLHGISVTDIADELGSAPQTIRNQLNIALKRLREKLVVR
ncbi:sigma-70 family RNA polymerase sigma factor [Cytophagaceae bacterium YF14B1]|uniref:Sigma-70 family RNA polymerase sigma factor n=1 Tax=Xanthocytophaga flava TaxID=3048013 RepID=A0AAE3U6U0_9BACT|nr:sigma-70 family RNA polymerase sigma factor [Xanthocytophaga flavus]MDJ1479448.1 sigma-70 family RNA polymerase sigma factor [Xanthocytophaga flavus]